MTNLIVFPTDYAGEQGKEPPAPSPVTAPGGTGASPADAAATGVLAAMNVGSPTDTVQKSTADAESRLDATDAAAKFPEGEAEAAAQMEGVGAEGSMAQMFPQMISGVAGAVAGALGGVLGPLTQVPQQAMSAGQGAMEPLMSAVQQSGDVGLDSDPLADLSDEELLGLSDSGLDGSDFGGGDSGGGSGFGDGGGGGGDSTSPTGYLGPPPVPTSSAPTTPAAAPAKGSVPIAAPSAPGTGTAMGAPMMPMMPPGAMGAGGDQGGKDRPAEKRISAPGVPNGQPVKGRLTVAPNVAVTKKVPAGDAKAGSVVRKRITDKADAEAKD